MGEYDFALPSLGADMDEATILEWKVAPGDTVSRGDIVAIIDTEKSELDLEIWHGGTVAELLVGEGEHVEVGTVLARLTGVDDAPEPMAAPSPAPAPAEPAEVGTSATADSRPAAARVRSPLVRHLAEDAHVDVAAIEGSGPGGAITRHDVEAAVEAEPAKRRAAPAAPHEGVAASPLARRLAAERGIDLATIEGSGPGGAVLATDVPEESPAPEPQPVSHAGGGRAETMRAAVAALMARSNREIPHYHLMQEIDMAAAVAWMEEYNTSRPPAERLIPVALLLKASALAARAHPELNGFWVEDRFEPAPEVHLGVAIALRGGGLVAPAIIDAAIKPLATVMAELRDLVERTRAGRLRATEMASPTVTVSNLGDRGPEILHGVIYPPQVALVGFGRVAPRAVVVDGAVEARPTVMATLAGDHRATDGDRGARMLATLDSLLQKPDEL